MELVVIVRRRGIVHALRHSVRVTVLGLKQLARSKVLPLLEPQNGIGLLMLWM